MLLRTAKSCGPDAPTLASSLRMFCRPYRASTKPLRAGMPGDSGVLVVTRVLSTTTSAHEAAGAAGIRHSPRPHFEGNVMHDSGASRREIVDAYPSRRPHGWCPRPALGGVWRS